MSQSLALAGRHACMITDAFNVKRFLPLITALVLALYICVPGELSPHFDLQGAAVVELQDELVYASPKQDDHCLLPAAFRVEPAVAHASELTCARVTRPRFLPVVPNIRGPPPAAAV